MDFQNLKIMIIQFYFQKQLNSIKYIFVIFQLVKVCSEIIQNIDAFKLIMNEKIQYLSINCLLPQQIWKKNFLKIIKYLSKVPLFPYHLKFKIIFQIFIVYCLFLFLFIQFNHWIKFIELFTYFI